MLSYNHISLKNVFIKINLLVFIVKKKNNGNDYSGA